MHTTVNPGGVIRGQLSKDVYVFFNQMTQAEENPPTGAAGTANSMTYVRVDRDSTGNVTGGAVSFNLNYNMGGAQTFTGLHIHNGKIGINGPVVINSGMSGSNTVVTFDVNYTNSGPITFTGLHIHYPGVAGVIAPVIINTGISGTSTVDSTTGAGNITRVVPVDPNNATAMATLAALITAPDTAYIN